MAWVRARLCKLQKGALDSQPQVIKVYQLLDHGRWFSPDSLASSTTNTGRHGIAESGAKHQKINQSIIRTSCLFFLSKNINTFNWNNSILRNILFYALLKTEQNATDLIKYKHLFTIYRRLEYNDISVIEDNAFNILPRLHNLSII